MTKNDSDYKAIIRKQYANYLDVTPTAETYSWKLLGYGITNGLINYNNQIETQKFIIDENSTSVHESNQKQMDLTQKCYKGEPCFEYINGLRDKTGEKVQGRILEVDMWNGTESSSTITYPAKLSKCITPVSSFMGEKAEIGYSIHFNGDPIEGTVTFANGVPTFTPTAE